MFLHVAHFQALVHKICMESRFAEPCRQHVPILICESRARERSAIGPESIAPCSLASRLSAALRPASRAPSAALTQAARGAELKLRATAEGAPQGARARVAGSKEWLKGRPIWFGWTNALASDLACARRQAGDAKEKALSFLSGSFLAGSADSEATVELLEGRLPKPAEGRNAEALAPQASGRRSGAALLRTSGGGQGGPEAFVAACSAGADRVVSVGGGARRDFGSSVCNTCVFRPIGGGARARRDSG
jgi:hypothetical protein